MMSATYAAVGGWPSRPLTVITTSNVPGLPGGSISNHSRSATLPPNEATTSRTAAAVPRFLAMGIAAFTRARLTCSGQYSFHVSTPRCHASHGSSASGIASGFMRVASGTGTSCVRALVAASARSSDVAFAGSRLFVIHAPIDQLDMRAVRRLLLGDRNAANGCFKDHLLYAGNADGCVQPIVRDLHAELVHVVRVLLRTLIRLGKCNHAIRAGERPKRGANGIAQNLRALHSHFVGEWSHVIRAQCLGDNLDQIVIRTAVPNAR